MLEDSGRVECMALLANAIASGDVLELEVAIAEAEDELQIDSELSSSSGDEECEDDGLEQLLLCAKTTYVTNLESCKAVIRTIRIGVTEGNQELLERGLQMANESEAYLQLLMGRDVERGCRTLHGLRAASATNPLALPSSSSSSSIRKEHVIPTLPAVHDHRPCTTVTPAGLAGHSSSLIERQNLVTEGANEARRKSFQAQVVATARGVENIVDYVAGQLQALLQVPDPLRHQGGAPEVRRTVDGPTAHSSRHSSESSITPRSSAPSPARSGVDHPSDIFLPSNPSSTSMSAASSRAPSPSPLAESRPPLPPQQNFGRWGGTKPSSSSTGLPPSLRVVRVEVDWDRFYKDEQSSRQFLLSEEEREAAALTSAGECLSLCTVHSTRNRTSPQRWAMHADPCPVAWDGPGDDEAEARDVSLDEGMSPMPSNEMTQLERLLMLKSPSQ